MIILTIRTDNPQAELGIFDGSQQLTYLTREAHRKLAETIHTQMVDMLKDQNLSLQDIRGIVVYKGPGSFTGLRIGIAVANTLAASLVVPIVGQGTTEWINEGVERLLNGQNEQLVVPEYGAPVHTTAPRK